MGGNITVIGVSQEDFITVRMSRENFMQKWRAYTLSALAEETWILKDVLSVQRSFTDVALR